MGFRSRSVSAVAVSVGNVHCLEPLYKFGIVNIGHSVAVSENPVNVICFVNIVNKIAVQKVESIERTLPPYKFALLFIVTPQRYNGEIIVIFTVIDNITVCGRTRYFELVGAFLTILFNRSSFTLDILGISVDFVKRSTERLVSVYLPKAYACHKFAVFLIVERRKFKHAKSFKLIKVPKTERHAADKSVFSELLQSCFKVRTELVFGIFIAENRTVSQKILIFLCNCKIEKVACDFVVCAPFVFVRRSDGIIEHFFVVHNRRV